MKIFIAGGTGLVGRALIDKLLTGNHEITALCRSARKAETLPAPVRPVLGDPMQSGAWQERVRNAEVVINLTGASIFARWTPENKRRIYDSRVVSTRNIVEALPRQPGRSLTLINASAAGYYGFCGDEAKREDAPPGDDFLARVCVAWENEALRARDKGVRVITPRFAVVLAREGGALTRMLPGFRSGLAGKLGHGRQWFSWIHLDELTGILLFLINRPGISGPVNCGAPNPVRNREFTRTLGAVLHRPTLVPAPGFLVRLVLGELGSVVLEGNRMVPGVLLKEGFSFRYPDLAGALHDLLGPGPA